MATRKAPKKAKAQAKPKKIGQPTPYSEKVVDTICERIARGESLNTICKDPAMPSNRAVCNWLEQHEDFVQKYARAREQQADKYAEEIVQIADEGLNDWMSENDPDNPGYRLNGEHVQRSKLRIDARKWVAAKLRPKVYGENNRTDLNVGGGLTVVIDAHAAKVL